MSVLVIAKFTGDVAKFRQSLADRGGEFVKVRDQARTAGAIHHRFGIGDGYVVVVDEREGMAHFEKFFADPELQAFIASTGAASQPPEITVAEAISSPDEF